MKHLTTCAVALCRAALYFTPSLALAEQNYTAHINDREMEHVLVSVPIHSQESQTALPVTVLSGETLRAAASATLGETLASKPGLASASFGPAVGRPVIRGQQGARVTVLQNSLRSADASSLSADHSVAVEPLLAESIEVLRGPAILMYGGGAIGGVVNVLDNRIPQTRADTVTGGVEYRHEGAAGLDVAAFNLTGGAETAAIHISGLRRAWGNLDIPGKAIDEQALDSLHDGHDHEEDEEPLENTEGYIANTGGLTRSFTLGISNSFDWGFAGISVSQLNNEYGIPPGAHAHHEEEGHEDEDHEGEDHEDEDHEDHEDGIRIDIDQTRYDARLLKEDPFAGVSLLNWQVSHTNYQHDEIESNGEIGTHFSNSTWESRVELNHQPIAGWHGLLGLQWRRGEFSALGEESFIPMTESTSTGLFLVEGYDQGDWTYEMAVRVDQDKLKPAHSAAQTHSFNSVSASASALWRVAPEWQVSLALSNAERAPVAEELYSNIDIDSGSDHVEYVVHGASQSIEIGNADLDSEQSHNADFKLTWQNAVASLDATIFYNQFNDYIYLKNTGLEQDEVPILRYQQEDATFYGLELEASFALLSDETHNLELTLMGDTLRARFDNGLAVPRMPPRRVGAKLSYQRGDWSAFIDVQDAAAQNEPGEQESATKAYTRWNLGLNYRVGKDANEGSLLFFAKLNNVSDEEIRLSTSFLRNYAPESGRSLVGGVRYTF